jgi:hypothetical protein
MIDKVSEKVNAVEEAKLREEIKDIVGLKNQSFLVERLVRLQYGPKNNHG